MTSVCVKNVGTSPEKLSPASHSRKSSKMNQESQPLKNEDPVDFEFLLEDPVTMLTADELFSDGKLVPLKFSGASNPEEKPMVPAVNTAEKQPCRRLEMEMDPYLFSPRAPRCTVRWRELLGLKRLSKTPEEASPSSSRLSSSTPNPKTSSFRHFLNRSSKSTPSSSAAAPPPPQPLIRDSDISESSTSISSSRLSLSSSSSSGHELDDVPRLSLDLDKPNAPNPFARSRAAHHHHLRNHQQRKPRRHHDETTESGGNNETRALTVTADSPRLNASGKIVFHGLERSSSSPGNFTGGPRLKQHHGMPRSQSAHVRITPVLNVPVSSLRGGGPKSGLFFGQLFTSSSSASASRAQLQSNTTTKNRTNRTRLEPTSEL
ncbi:Uncharacterized protein HA466_0023720 [Hirschfeldia incana]|nr:Uncharacterized protein HA466_0023720 [Hirschfeldia incana]